MPVKYFSKRTAPARRLLQFMMIGMLLGLLAGAGSGCRLANNDSGSSENAAATLVISGSTSMEEMNNALAEAYQANHPEINIRIQALGSSEGIQAALKGVADIGASSRALTSEEKTASPDLQEIIVAMDGIAVVVNPDNPVSGLNREQIKGIYSGKIRNWQEIGGNDHEITVIRREDGSGTLGAFCELVLGEKEKNAVFWRLAIVQNSTGAILNTVASDPNAIGFVSMSVLDQRVKALDIDGIAPEFDKVLDGSYTLQRPYVYIVNGAPSEAVQAFIDFALSPEGRQVITEAHAIPIN